MPIIFVSSALQWRVGIRLNECVCIAMSLFNNFRHERLIANESEWRLFLGGKAWAETNKVAQEAVKSGYILSRPGEMPSWYEEIRRKLEELEEVKTKLAMLEAHAHPP